MDDRQLSIDEQFLRITVTQSNRDHFMELNTSPMPSFEQLPNGEYIGVRAIRYNGMRGTDKNTWGLK